MTTLKDSLLDRFQLSHIEREVEGATVFIKQLSDAETEAYQFKRINLKTGEPDYHKMSGASAEFVALCFCEEDGTRMFKTGAEVAKAFSSSFTRAAYKVCADINGLTGETEEAGKD